MKIEVIACIGGSMYNGTSFKNNVHKLSYDHFYAFGFIVNFKK